MGGGEEGLAPLVEEGFDLDGVFFGDVLVGAGGDEAEDVGKSRLGGVVGFEADVGVGEGGLRARSDGGGEEGTTPEGGRAEQQRGESHAFEEGSPGELRFFVAVIWHDSRWRNRAGKASAGYHPMKIVVRGMVGLGMVVGSGGGGSAEILNENGNLNLLVDIVSTVVLLSRST